MKKLESDYQITICGKIAENGKRCLLEKNHATPRAISAPMSIESYGDGSAVENFGCFGVEQ